MLGGIGHLCTRQCEEQEKEGTNEFAATCNKVVSHSIIEAVSKG